MKCKEVSDLISWYADGCLPSNKAEAVRRHIEGCACCQAEMAAEQVSAKVLASPMTSFDAPDVLAHVRSRVSRRQTARPRWQWALAGVAAACCLIWLAPSLVPQRQATQRIATDSAIGPVSSAPQIPVVTVEPQRVSPAAEEPTPEKPRVVRTKSPKPHRKLAHHAPAPKRVAAEPQIEYLVVYKHPDMGDGIEVAVNDGTSNPASSSYSIRMTDDSTGAVTDVSAYSNSDGGSEENATVEFRSETPDADGPERSSTDEIPLHMVGAAAHSDRC